MSLSEMRDNGPFKNADQVIKQWASWALGMPLPTDEITALLMREVTMLARVLPTEFELEYVEAAGLDPIQAQIVAAWVLRAFQAGRATSLGEL